MTNAQPEGGVQLKDVTRRFIRTNDDDNLLIRRQQDIPPDFWDRLKQTKKIQDEAPAGEFLKVASIPAVVVEEWYAQGFNIFDKNVTLKEILARLRMEDKDNLITTSRQL